MALSIKNTDRTLGEPLPFVGEDSSKTGVEVVPYRGTRRLARVVPVSITTLRIPISCGSRSALAAPLCPHAVRRSRGDARANREIEE